MVAIRLSYLQKTETEILFSFTSPLFLIRFMCAFTINMQYMPTYFTQKINLNKKSLKNRNPSHNIYPQKKAERKNI